MLLKGIVMAMTKVPPGTPLYESLSKANLDIGKHLDPGSASAAGESNALKTMAMQRARMQPHIAAQGTQAGGPPGGAPPAKPPMPPAA